jgi:hypothetical protein
MKKRLTSLMLLLVLAGGAFAGVPLHFSEQSCSMGEATDEMDCCKAALMQRETPEVDVARICCALDCAQNGTTAPPGIVRVSPPSQPAVAAHPTDGQAPLTSLLPLRLIDQLHGPPRKSLPAYIRHLSLLI